jgi:uncharacterized repeat protein (TIGR04076 family)
VLLASLAPIHAEEVQRVMDNAQNRALDLGIDLSKPMDHDTYHRYWDAMPRIEIRLVAKLGECKHNLGDVYYYENPYKRPEGVCFALLHVLDLYTWRVTMGFPSWNEQNPMVHRIHCTDHTGTIWEMRRVETPKPPQE